MGILDIFRGRDQLERREELTTDLELALAAAIRERADSFSLADALALPPVARAVDLIVTIGATFAPVEYLGGQASPDQPRLLRQPDPFATRYEWLTQVLLDLVQDAESFWLLGESLEGYPSHAVVLPHDEVIVEWDSRRFGRIYSWRGRRLIHGQDILHVAINRRRNELHGRSILRAALRYLGAVSAAEDFAIAAFGSGGIPTTVLRVAGAMTAPEAKLLREEWTAQRREAAATGSPAVISAGVEAIFPDLDPQTMQLQEARSYGATVVARLLGIPGPMLLAETSGATVTYQNVDAIASLLVKTTILPKYLAPVEAALSVLVPRTKAVRFSLAELTRADLATRFSVYAQAIAAGVLTAEEARAMEGWGTGPAAADTAYLPVPSLTTGSSVEVPA
jgi:HK97 family phage portal protein